MLATFCDVMISLSAHYQLRPGLFIVPTINLSIDYLASTPLGAWVEAHSEFPRATRRLVFGQTLLKVDGEAMVRASAILRRATEQPANGAADAGVIDTGELLHAHLSRSAHLGSLD